MTVPHVSGPLALVAAAAIAASATLHSAEGTKGCNSTNTVPVAADVTQIVLSCGSAVLTAVEHGATTFEEIVTALAGSTCGPVTVAEVESIVQLFMGNSLIEGGTLPLDVAARARAPEMQAKLKALHHK